LKVALASVAPVPLAVTAVDEYLSETAVSVQSIQEAARLAQQACSPIDDVRSSARYRKAMVRNLTEQALLKTWATLEGRG
jgi:CO/xanthine dehydrogenase FAD-binding subunit